MSTRSWQLQTGNEAIKARDARIDAFRALELDTENDWHDYVSGPVGVHDRFAVFDADFEVALRACFGAEYEALEADAKETLGKAKPLIARAAARGLVAPPTDGASTWDPLRPLAAQILALVE